MNAAPALSEVARAIRSVALDTVLIGNAAAALQGAPVTTVDFDFFYRRTPRNIAKLKRLARVLGAVVLRPYYPVSNLFRIVRDDDGLQVDFMGTIHGIRSFEGVRGRATIIKIGEDELLVAALADIIKSKKAAGRPRDFAVLEVLEKSLEETSRTTRPPRRSQTRG